MGPNFEVLKVLNQNGKLIAMIWNQNFVIATAVTAFYESHSRKLTGGLHF